MSFDSFVKGSLELAAASAEKARNTFFDQFTEIPQSVALSQLLDLAGLNDEALRREMESYCNLLVKRRGEFVSVKNISALTQLPSEDISTKLKEIGDNLEQEAKLFDEDAKTTKKEELTKQARELAAQKWLSQQKSCNRSRDRTFEESSSASRSSEANTHARPFREKS
jgi:hypothetical protein